MTDDKFNPNKYDNHVPSWLKGVIGGFAALILVPSVAFIAVVKLGGVEDIMQAWAKQQLKISEPVVNSNKELAIQILQLNTAITSFKDETSKQSKLMDSRLEAVEGTLLIHGAQIESGLKELQKLQTWAYEHSKNGSVDYAP